MVWWFTFGPYSDWINQLNLQGKFRLCTSPPDLCVHGPAACGSWKVVPGGTSWTVLHKLSDLLPACAIHSPGRSHWTTSPGLASAGHGGICQSRCFGTLYYRELLLLPGEWTRTFCIWRWRFGEDVIAHSKFGLHSTYTVVTQSCNMSPWKNFRLANLHRGFIVRSKEYSEESAHACAKLRFQFTIFQVAIYLQFQIASLYLPYKPVYSSENSRAKQVHT